MRVLNNYSFGLELYHIIEEKGLTVKDVADYLDVSVQAVHSWLNGKKTPKLEKVVTLAYLLDVTVDELLPFMDVKWKGGSLNGMALEERRQAEEMQKQAGLNNRV